MLITKIRHKKEIIITNKTTKTIQEETIITNSKKNKRIITAITDLITINNKITEVMRIEAEEVKEDEGQEESIIEVKISRDYHELTEDEMW